MAIEIVYTCDVCGKTKGPANHWWRVDFNGIKSLGIHPFSSTSERPEDQHLCGEGCVLKRVTEYMRTQK